MMLGYVSCVVTSVQRTRCRDCWAQEEEGYVGTHQHYSDTVSGQHVLGIFLLYISHLHGRTRPVQAQARICHAQPRVPHVSIRRTLRRYTWLRAPRTNCRPLTVLRVESVSGSATVGWRSGQGWRLPRPKGVFWLENGALVGSFAAKRFEPQD